MRESELTLWVKRERELESFFSTSPSDFAGPDERRLRAVTVTDSLNTLIGGTDHPMPAREQEMLNIEASLLAIDTKFTFVLVESSTALYSKSDQDQATCVAIVTSDPEMTEVCEVLAPCSLAQTPGADLGKAAAGRRAAQWKTGFESAARQPSKPLCDFQLAVLLSHPPTDPAIPASPSNMGDEPRKRSRFDQAEPDPPRRSKFDRRSRSPAQRDSEGAARSRSPVAKSVESTAPKRDAAAAAAEAAARINAQLSQKKAPQHVDVPPIRAVRWPQPQ